MAKQFRLPVTGPAHLASQPQKAQAPERLIDPGLEHRPFSEDEIKQAFDTFDLDSNRFVGAMELRHILEIIGEEATDEEIDEMIRMCDNDGDGQVTFDEFQKMMTQPPLPPPPAQLVSKMRNRQKNYGRGQQQEENVPKKGKKGKKEMAALDAGKRKQRAESIEVLVRKLAGGMARIKPSQIKRIYKRFQDIDLDKSGAVDYEEFIMALEMENSTISRQMFKVFDMDDSGSIDLKEFIVVLSRYTEASKAEKLKFAFMMFDEDGSGAIERSELLEMLAATFVVEGYSQAELEEKCDQIFETLGLDPDAGIEYQDFLKLASDRRALLYPIEEKQFTAPGQNVF